jgi:hypothetical protein
MRGSWVHRLTLLVAGKGAADGDDEGLEGGAGRHWGPIGGGMEMIGRGGVRNDKSKVRKSKASTRERVGGWL